MQLYSRATTSTNSTTHSAEARRSRPAPVLAVRIESLLPVLGRNIVTLTGWGVASQNDVGTLEQQIAEAEAELAGCEAQLTQLSVLDPLHEALSLRIRTQRSAIEVLRTRRLELLRAKP